MTNYAWNVNSGGNIIAGGGTNTISVLWDTPGTHQVNVIYTNSNNCTAVNPGKRFVNVHPLPVPAVSGPDSLCRNTTANYSTEPGMTGYSWTVTGGTIVSGGSTNSVDVQWNTAGSQTVSVSYTDPKGCIPLTPTDFNVQVNALPVPTISGNDTLCQGSAESYFTETGMTSYSWTISPGGTILSGSGTPSVAVQWNTAGSQSVTVNYVNSDGCAAQFPAVRAITVNPLPAPVISGPNPVCELSAPVYASPSFPGHAYNWTVTGGTIPSGQGTSSITVQWGVAGTGIIGLTETISATGCFAPAVPLNVTLNPYPLAAGGITGPSTVCENTSGIAYSILPVSFATSYSWTYSGTGVTIVNNGASITADFATGATGGTFSVQGVNGCGTGPSSGLNVTVNPRPVVSHITCNDPITTTTAQPFRLKGAIPPGGTYSGSGVTAGVFNPSVAGPGVHIITYGYTNSYACPASTTFSLSVVSPPPFACNNNFTDIRDNQQYPTVNIGGRCWMAMNLNYGTTIPSTAMQRDNCVPEKYCFNDNSSNCSTQGGLYQWDELMQFAPIAGSQGICPPGWHVPTETEWNTLFSNYISPGFAGDPLK
jgi:hypothetical protein